MSDRSTQRVLVVDDDEAGRYATARLLRRAGIEVVEASTGEEGLRRAREEKPDLVLLDVNLPDLSGFEVCRRLRQTPETAHLLVVHLSASFVEDAHHVLGLEGGADGYLNRGQSPEVLVATVRAYLRLARAEREARAEAERLRAVKDAALDAIVQIDAEGRVVLWNRAAENLFGFAASEVLGREIHPLVTPVERWDDAVRGLAIFRETGRGELLGKVVELEALRKGGGRFAAELSLAPLSLEGRFGAVAVVRDITARKAAEEERRRLEAAERERRFLEERAALARGAADEARNPLFALLVNLKALLRRLPDRADLLPFVENLEEHGRRLETLMGDLIELGTLPPVSEWVTCDLRDMLESSCTDVLAANPTKLWRFVRRFGEGQRWVRGVPAKLRRLFRDLLQNAVEASPPGEAVLLEMGEDGEAWRVAVEDQGGHAVAGGPPGPPHPLPGEPFRQEGGGACPGGSRRSLSWGNFGHEGGAQGRHGPGGSPAEGVPSRWAGVTPGFQGGDPWRRHVGAASKFLLALRNGKS